MKPKLFEVLKKIIVRINKYNSIALMSVTIAIIALFIQLLDIRSSNLNRREDNIISKKSEDHLAEIAAVNTQMAKSIKNPEIPYYEGVVDGTENNQEILNFISDNVDAIFRLKLNIPSSSDGFPVSGDDQLMLGCELTKNEECTPSLLYFPEKCGENFSCLGWYSGEYRVDGYFTVIATQAQMGILHYTLKPVSPELVLLR